ncbi:hypothetical protein GOP47_0024484 [Adiantum capillus-veneris]|uniref:Sec-independent protein translocase protein TATB, chloroplastic n=1 Tax=Adiantum capillus-veneris TaxID=13818 RepID=A0A9D4U1Y7_ADICA|nr:hypothetical protein GOP47_0024484 [Adiantum capillus-veneris]
MAGGAVVLPTSPVGARTSWTQKEPASLSNSPRAYHLHLRFPSLPRSSFFAWDARTHLGSPSLRSLLSSTDCLLASKLIPRRVVHASLLGVGAPEALVIAVVALLVFGPRGLAEVARTLGKSLRAFQPTIRELQQISKDFKDTLEQEIGLDELRSGDARPPPTYTADQQSQATADTQSESVKPKAYSTEDYVRVTEEQARALVPEEQRKAAEAAAWGGSATSVKTQTEEPIQRADEVTNNAGDSQ